MKFLKPLLLSIALACGSTSWAAATRTEIADAIKTSNGTNVLTVPATTDTLAGIAATQTLTNKTISGSSNTITNVSLTSGVTGTLPLANGGTNATTKAGAFDSLSPMTTGGDIIYGGASGTGTRLANGSAGQFLKSNGGTAAPSWATGATGYNYQDFTSSGSFVVPTGVTNIEVVCVGGGAGGGSSSSPSANGGGGGSGGAGASPLDMILAVTSADTLTITIGTAGAAGTAPGHNVAGNNGGAGGDTTITGTAVDILCPGSSGVGIGGLTASSGASTGGAGTYTTSVVGSITGSAGGNSGSAFNVSGVAGGASVWAATGAAGGTSGGTNSNSGRGGGGGGGGMCKGGTGGNGGANGLTGAAGNAPGATCYGGGGGGGGGSGASGALAGLAGGAGAKGFVRIIYGN